MLRARRFWRAMSCHSATPLDLPSTCLSRDHRWMRGPPLHGSAAALGRGCTFSALFWALVYEPAAMEGFEAMVPCYNIIL